jgi:cell wall-associated NlpC family hydrolase
MTTRADIVARAREWIGTPYRHQGRRRDGCDCLGLIVGVAAELGLARWVVPGYSGHPDGHSLAEACDRHLVSQLGLDPGEIEAGMVALFWYARRGFAQHLAILTRLDDRRLAMVHSLQRNDRVVEHGLSAFWNVRLLSAWDYPGVARGAAEVAGSSFFSASPREVT